MRSIKCFCGACELMLKQSTPLLRQFCGCKDCAQGLRWAASKGGPKPKFLPELIYFKSDITCVRGEMFMKPYKLRKSGSSTRVYCNKCYALIGVDNPHYQDNVFLQVLGHFATDIEFSIQPSAAIFMAHHLSTQSAEILVDIPIFNSFDNPDDLHRWMTITSVRDTFKAPERPPSGRSFRELIASFESIEVLNLQVGAEPT